MIDCIRCRSIKILLYEYYNKYTNLYKFKLNEFFKSVETTQ